jgi:hypothetical protein
MRSEMDFPIETENITKDTIEKFINILLSMIHLVQANKCLLQILQVKLNMSISWCVYS